MSHSRWIAISLAAAACLALAAGAGFLAGRRCGREEPGQSGCRSKAPGKIEFGTMEGSVYRNRYFGLTVTLPSGWSIQDQAARRRITDMGAKVVAGKDKGLKAVMEASDLRTVNLMAAFKHPVGAPVPYNPSIMAVAEDVRPVPGIKTGKDYHFHTKRLLAASPLKASFPKEMSAAQLGGVDFAVLHIEMSLAGIKIQQKQYAAVMRGYALVFVVAFMNAEDEAVLEGILKSVKFR